LAENTYLDEDWKIFTRLAGYRHCTGFDGVMKLSMAATGSNMNPAVFFDYSDYISHPHDHPTVTLLTL
jgi:hypothetical protein